jgi:hypothetical protein
LFALPAFLYSGELIERLLVVWQRHCNVDVGRSVLHRVSEALRSGRYGAYWGPIALGETTNADLEIDRSAVRGNSV